MQKDGQITTHKKRENFPQFFMKFAAITNGFSSVDFSLCTRILKSQKKKRTSFQFWTLPVQNWESMDSFVKQSENFTNWWYMKKSQNEP